MAYEIGTASDHVDLFDKLIAFVTANADLLYDGEAWEIAWSKSSDLSEGVVLKGPGLAATDEIFVGLRLSASIPDDSAEIAVVGMTGVIPTSAAYNDHINVTPNAPRMLLRTQPMDYWFVANGRRFMVMVRVSTVYEALYAGFFLPYSTPDQYTYPLFIGGCAHSEATRGSVSNWRSTFKAHAHYTRSFRDPNASNGHPSNAWLLDPSGNWLDGGITTDSNVQIAPGQFGTGFGIRGDASTGNYGWNTILDRIIPAYGNDQAMIPVTLLQQSPSDQTYGVLDGVYRVMGRGNAPENTIVVDGVTHVVGTNTFRTDLADFWAMQIGVVP